MEKKKEMGKSYILLNVYQLSDVNSIGLDHTNDGDRKLQKYFQSVIEGKSGLGYKGPVVKGKKKKNLLRMRFKKSDYYQSEFKDLK